MRAKNPCCYFLHVYNLNLQIVERTAFATNAKRSAHFKTLRRLCALDNSNFKCRVSVEKVFSFCATHNFHHTFSATFAHNWSLCKTPIFAGTLNETRARVQALCKNLMCAPRFVNCYPAMVSACAQKLGLNLKTPFCFSLFQRIEVFDVVVKAGLKASCCSFCFYSFLGLPTRLLFICT